MSDNVYKKKFKKIVLKNGSYKVVALCVSLVLWVTILGRKDIVINQDVTLQAQLAPHQLLRNEIPKKVKIRISGPRMSLKKFIKSGEQITIDMTNLPLGRQRVEISKSTLNLPLGVKILSISPTYVRAYIVQNKSFEKEQNDAEEK